MPAKRRCLCRQWLLHNTYGLELAKRGCHDGAIHKNNMKDKNRDKDRWISPIRSPLVRVFSKCRKRVRYRSRTKNQFAAFMGAMSLNFKRLPVLRCQPLWP